MFWLRAQFAFWWTARLGTRLLVRILSHPDAVIGAVLFALLLWLADQPYKGT